LVSNVAVQLSGSCKISSPGIALSGTNAVLAGSGEFATTITYTGNSGSAIIMTGLFAQARDFSLIRTGTPDSSATGIDASAGLAYPLLANIYVTGHWNGFILGSSARGIATNLFSEKNFGHGFVFVNTVGSQPNQWDIAYTLSQKNDGLGYLAQSNNTDTQMIMGTWFHPTAFANSGGGFWFIGSAGHTINDSFLISPVGSGDGNDELNYNTFGRNNSVIGGFMELAGTSVTGHLMTTPATHIGAGLNVGANEGDWLNVIGGTYDSNSFEGITSSAAGIMLNGVTSVNNGQAGTHRSGAFINQNGIINGGEYKNTGGGSGQTFGISANNGVLVNIIGANLTPNVTGGITATTNQASMLIVGSQGGNNADTYGAWNTFTATPSCGTATITTTTAKYKFEGKTTFLVADFTITALGTCGGANNFTFTLPNTINGAGSISGQNANTGKGVTCILQTTTANPCRMADVTAIANGDRFIISGVYENQ